MSSLQAGGAAGPWWWEAGDFWGGGRVTMAAITVRHSPEEAGQQLASHTLLTQNTSFLFAGHNVAS